MNPITADGETVRRPSMAKIMRKVMRKFDSSRDPPLIDAGDIVGDDEEVKKPKTQIKNKRNRNMLDRHKPVSLTIDFKGGFLPDGLFLGLCTLLYSKYTNE